MAMPVLNGIDAGWLVKQLRPTIQLIYLTMTHDEELAGELIRQGASGYLIKTCTSSELVVAVREVSRGKQYLSSGLSKERFDICRWGHDHRETGRLTDRQRQVLQLLAEGKPMKEVGNILDITTGTVAVHKYKAMDALG
jgi:DNA-binding NarL/FixJ family response regulator